MATAFKGMIILVLLCKATVGAGFSGGLLFDVDVLFLLWPCVSRTAGEILFCYSPKEYPEKAATSATPL